MPSLALIIIRLFTEGNISSPHESQFQNAYIVDTATVCSRVVKSNVFESMLFNF